ncbi:MULTISPECIES: pyridoxamine 5'-phosphate oxidase family protein [Chitinophagaceae]|uniref:pyridoxamine 5'-phosphate oxidase family protein n=1 Tax=Chitinophagaceae TaxID=563835 RepID=UPI000DF014F8|nr:MULTISPECIES: pyridoxamine 5'-phosphate oxidase family protein [Chitinophagaceae]RPD47348.1 hypothetical protein DRJ53_12665 [Paracnuella aquatica]
MALFVAINPEPPYMDATITAYLHEQKLASVCCVDAEGFPYCFNCYCAYDEANGWLYFKSSPDTAHARMIAENRRVAGTILPAKLTPLDTRGVQFTGEVLPDDQYAALRAARLYYKRYPFAVAISGHIYAVQLNCIKLSETHNGLKKKWLWKRSEHELAGI